jgi:hypothetical protein
MADKKEFVLFLVKDCKYCETFYKKIVTKPELIKKFNIVDIDEIPDIPDEIAEVPAVYDGKSVYQGPEAFKWLNEKMSDFLLPANDSLNYSFLEGHEEQVFSGFSLLNQMNGSNGMGDSPIKPQNTGGRPPDTARMSQMGSEPKSSASLDSIVALREADMKSFK